MPARGCHGIGPSVASAGFDHQPIDCERGDRQRQDRRSASTACRSRRPREYAAEEADVTLRLWQVLKPRMVAEHMATVYETLERPLVAVLARMEGARHLDRPAGAVAALRRVRAAARRARGGDPEARRRAAQSGQPQAARRHLVRPDGPARRHQDQDRRNGPPAPRVLDELAEQGHALPQKILDWRQVVEAAARPTPTRCRATSMPRPIASTRSTRWPRRRPAACRHPSPTCRTSRSAPRKAARSAAPSSRSRAHKLDLRRLFADRAAAPGRDRATSRC